MGESGERQFGRPPAGGQAVERRGVYAVVLEGERVLVVETPVGWYLPGGGVEPGEAIEAALRREVREETGYDLAALVWLGVARQYAGAATNKVETFYRAAIGGEGTSCEADHQPRWVSVEEALARLREEAQAWAVQRARERTGGDGAG